VCSLHAYNNNNNHHHHHHQSLNAGMLVDRTAHTEEADGRIGHNSSLLVFVSRLNLLKKQ